MNDYYFKITISKNFVDSINIVKEELKNEGFGIVSEIDVKKTMKEKLNIDYDNYIILGACNPSFAHEALNKEKDIGLLLPCNVVVYSEVGSDDKKTVIAAIKPKSSMSRVLDNNDLMILAGQVQEKLNNVINSINKR